MKVSIPLRVKEVRYESSTDPHNDPLHTPRFSFPISFLPLRAYLLALVILSIITGTTATTGTGCVCNYNPNVDYFPVKYQPDAAKLFTIEYFNSYKKVTATKAPTGQTFVTYAYLCGTPAPIVNETGASLVQVPITTAAVTSTTFLPMIEYINQQNSLVYIAADASTFTACEVALYDNKQLAAGYVYAVSSELSFIDKIAINRTGAPLDVIFMDDYYFKLFVSFHL